MPHPSTKEEIVTIVDRENRVIGTAPRAVMRRKRLTHRATYCMVFSEDGRLFIQKRTGKKDIYPSHWEVSAGGVVAADEDYHSSARRELKEELGIEPGELTHLFDFFYEDHENSVWGRAYKCIHNGPFTLQEEEVEEGRFVTIRELRAMIHTLPFTPDSLELLRRLWPETF